MTALETHTIYQIPLDQRHGRARDLFTIWFGANIMMLTIVTGALAPTIYGLTLTQSVAAIIAGNVVGGVFMALHAAQGAVLGVPQMVQTRGQFGNFGAIAVIALVVLMYIGFVASNFVLGGQSLHLLAGGFGSQAYIVAICAISLVAATLGHDVIHACTKWLSWIAGAALVSCFAWIAFVDGLSWVSFGKGHYSTGGFLGAVATGALWQIAYAPYVSDYSRYLPPGIGARHAFWASYAGCVLGSVFPMILGAILVMQAGTPDVIPAFARMLGPLALIVVPIFSLGIAAGSAMNVYCGVLSSIAIAQTFLPSWRARGLHRIGLSCVLSLASLAIALFAAAHFMEAYTSFILLLLYVLVPWTAINLVDFYLIKHGNYDVDSFFRADGGCYGRYNAVALACYGVGILVQIPFVANPLYTGPVAAMLGGADLSWIAGLLIVGPLYWALMRKDGAVFENPKALSQGAEPRA